MSVPQESQKDMYVESFFLNGEEAQIKGAEDRKVFIECRSQNQRSEFDIVFIHSLGRNRFDTWRCGDVFWPDYLVDDSPGARVILFNYDTRLWFEPSLNTIQKAANDLKSLLRRARRDDSSTRPIIWVAHSLGGFLAKAACIQSTKAPLRKSKTIDVLHDNLEDATSGAIFIGTPHTALFVGGWLPILQRVYEAAGHQFVANHSTTKNIEEVVYFLSRFHSVMDEHQLRIFSFYEQHEASGISLPILVTSFQNALFHPREALKTLPGNYLTMCRFHSRLDPGYESLKYALEAIRSLPVDRDDSNDIIPVALPKSELERSVVFAVQASKDEEIRTSQDDSYVMPLSVIQQFAPAVKARRLTRFLSFPRSYVPIYPPIDNQDTQGYITWILSSNEFQDWRTSDKLLVINGLSGVDKSIPAYHIAQFLGYAWLDESIYGPRKCVLNYFFRASHNFEQTIAHMLSQFLLQFLEMIPSLVSNFPTGRVFSSARPNWPEWDTENASQDDQCVEDLQLDFPDGASESHRGFSHKDLSASPFTILELLNILFSILHDEQVGEVILVIDGLDDASARAQSQFQYFLNLLESLRTRAVKVCLTCHTTQIQSLKPIVYLKPPLNEFVIIGKSEGPESVLCAWYETQEAKDLASEDVNALIKNIRAIRLQSHLSLAIARQIVGRLLSLNDIAEFTDCMQRWGQGVEHSETDEINTLYEWVFNYLNKSTSWKQIGVLLLVAVAERSLTISEACNLAPLAEELASRYLGFTPNITAVPADQTTLLSDIDTARGVHALETRLLGLLIVTEDALAVYHTTFKTFLRRKIDCNNFGFYSNYHVGLFCLRLIHELKNTTNWARYNGQDRRHSVAIGKFSYPLQYWSKHIQAAHSSNQWNSSHSAETLSLLTDLWENARTRGLIRKFCQVMLPPITELPLSCVLVSCDLSKVLDMFYDSKEREADLANQYLTLDQRCAAVNFGHRALEILKKHNRVNNSIDQYGKSLSSYESWAKSREFAEHSSLSWVFESMNAHIAEEKCWDTIKQMLREEPLGRLRANGSLDRLLLLAIHQCDEETTTALLDIGANCNFIDQDDPHKPSVLHIAAALGVDGIVHELVFHGSRMSMTDAFGRLPIHWAAERGHNNIVQILITPLPDLDIDRQSGQNPLFMACESLSKPTVEVLLRFGHEINHRDKWQRTPIHTASATGSTNMVRLLLSKGADAEARDENQITPLHLAAFGGWTMVVDELLSAGVLSDALTTGQQTPLHFACISPNPSLEVALTLLQRQCNPNIMDGEGMTPLAIAVKKGSVAMVQLLLKAIPYPCDMDKLLSLAEGNKEIVWTLLKHQHHHNYRLQSVQKSKLPSEGKPLVNVVFVHGYFHSPETTWSDGSSQLPWPEKYLPTSEARARVFFWDRRLELTDFSSLDNVRELGTLLLDYVVFNVLSNGDGSSSESGSRSEPVVFISHSLGGLVVKAAIAEASLARHNPLLFSTKGIVFLGTPHMTENPQYLNKTVKKLVQSAVINRLDPGQDALASYRGAVRRDVEGKDSGDYNKLDLQFMRTCGVQRIKVLTFADDTNQLVPSECAFYESSFAPDMTINKNITISKKHKCLGRVNDTQDIVYAETLRFLLTVLSEERRFESEITNLPVLKSYTSAPVILFPPGSPAHQLQATSSSANTSIQGVPESSPFPVEIPDLFIALEQTPQSHIPDTSRAVNSSLLKHLEGKYSDLDSEDSKVLWEWRHKPENRGLWVLGKAGSGKTFLMAQLFNHLKLSSVRHETVAAFFFNRFSPDQRTAVDMLRSILLQILCSREDLVRRVQYERDYYNVIMDPSSTWSTLISIYHKTIRIALDLASDSEFVFLLDAVDECNSSDYKGSRLPVEACVFIQDCLGHESIKVCLASRPQNELLLEFGDRTSKLHMEDFNHHDIARYVETRLAATVGSSKGMSKTSEALAIEVIQRAQGVMLWVTLTVDNLIQGLKQFDTDEQLSRRIRDTPKALEMLYMKMGDEIPLEYRHETVRTLRIAAIAPFPLDIEVLSLAIAGSQVSDRKHRRDLRAINGDLEVVEPERHGGLEDEEQKSRAAMRVNSRCGGLLSVRNNKDIQFIHESAKTFITQPHTLEAMLGVSDDGFDPAIGLLSACIIRIRQSVDSGWLKAADKDERLPHRIWQAFTAAALADANHKDKLSYLRLFDELAAVCWRIRHLQPVQIKSSDQSNMVTGSNRIQDIPKELYATLCAIHGGMWSYLRSTVDEQIMTIGDTCDISLLTHLINPKDLDCLPWASCTMQPRVSRELPPEDVVQAFFAENKRSLTHLAIVAETRSAWREVLEAGYHVFPRDEVPCNPGPAPTDENGYRWVKIVGIFLNEGADVDAEFPGVRFKPRAELAASPGGSYYPDPPRAASNKSTTHLAQVKTLEPRRTLQDVMWPQRDYNLEYEIYRDAIKKASKTGSTFSPELPFSSLGRARRDFLQSGAMSGHKIKGVGLEEKTISMKTPTQMTTGDTTRSGRARIGVSSMLDKVATRIPWIPVSVSTEDRNRRRIELKHKSRRPVTSGLFEQRHGSAFDLPIVLENLKLEKEGNLVRNKSQRRGLTLGTRISPLPR